MNGLDVTRLIIGIIVGILAFGFGFRMMYTYYNFNEKSSIFPLLKGFYVFSLIIYFIGHLTFLLGIIYATNNSNILIYDFIVLIGWGCYIIFFNILVWILWIRVTFTFDKSVIETNKKYMKITKIIIIICEIFQILAVIANIPSLDHPFGITATTVLTVFAAVILIIYAGLAIYIARKLFNLFNYAVKFNLTSESDKIIEGISVNHINNVSKYVLCTLIQLLSTLMFVIIYFATINTQFQIYFDVILFMIDFIINELTIYLQLGFAFDDYKLLCNICDKGCKKLIESRMNVTMNAIELHSNDNQNESKIV